MRSEAQSADNVLKVNAIAGTRAILLAFSMEAATAKGLLGFAIRALTNGGLPKWLTGMKVFPSLAPKDTHSVKALHFQPMRAPFRASYGPTMRRRRRPSTSSKSRRCTVRWRFTGKARHQRDGDDRKGRRRKEWHLV